VHLLGSQYRLMIRYLALFGFVSGCILFGVLLYLSDLESPLPTLLILDCHDRYICEVRDGGNDAEAGYWSINPIPSRVAATVQAVEDHRFNWHPGVDPFAVFRAVIQNIRSGYRVSGASTIAMQVARLQRPAERTYYNKIRETIDAVSMTIRFGRTRVMDHYLRIAPYGNGIRGLGYASRYYFNKPVEDLSWAEIAFLSAIPQQPNRMNPRTASGRTNVVNRARQILDIVFERQMMTSHQYLRAKDQVPGLVLCQPNRQSLNCIHLALRYEKIFNNPDNRQKLRSPCIQTAIDLDIQEMIAEENRMCVDAWSVSGAGNGAVMVIDTTTREVISLVGSTDYFDVTRAGAIDYTDVSRSPGSTLKPFIYALALDKSIVEANSYIADDTQHSSGFRNFDREYLGRISLRKALGSSRNIPAVNLLKKTGVYRTYGCFADLYLHDYQKSCDVYGLGMAIGGLPVTMEKLARAYTVFTNAGNLEDLQWYKSDMGVRSRSIFSQKTVSRINDFLSDPLARLPSFPRMGHLEFEYPVAIKTGTSEGCRDAWAVAWTSRYMVITWTGRPDGQPMREVSGYRVSADLAHVIMDKLQRDKGCEVFETNPIEEKDTEIIEVVSDSIEITSPEDGGMYYFDPEIPDNLSTILLAAEVNTEKITRLTWEIDGTPLQTVKAPFTSRWLMKPGIHQIRIHSADNPGSHDEIQISVRDVQ